MKPSALTGVLPTLLFEGAYGYSKWNPRLLRASFCRVVTRGSSWDVVTKQTGATNHNVDSWLVCGDGDLSYSAQISALMNDEGVSLTATVLEDEETHNLVYENSKANSEHILSFPTHQLRFGIDATRLGTLFGERKFDRIQFNFPHWRGKANNKWNRELLNSFLKSAPTVLSKNGEVHVAFCEGQGGSSATDLQKWRQSWTAALYAAEHGLILRSVEPFRPTYSLSSHRGVDRPFQIGKDPKLYKFSFPNTRKVNQAIQLCCRHELHLMLPEDGHDELVKDLLHADFVEKTAKSIVPDGIRVEVPLRRVLTPEESGCKTPVAVFLLLYCGERIPLTRDAADSYRDQLETKMSQIVMLRESRTGRLVSKPFTYSALYKMIEEKKALHPEPQIV